KARKNKAKLQAKIANKRNDALHKITTELVKQYDVIVIENLKSKNMMKNHNLANAVSSNAWYAFKSMLEYKCNWYGKQ
ncbi:IS200/IS605 family accessory protein TnpB-related protein, partial [Ligilactobacillus equi]|uniref:IS200/IS605 family accessory protein TnpB-related protein n=1 Tax=Ligilactobacillus equi TaxID=137357 RepID=UPI000AF4D49D